MIIRFPDGTTKTFEHSIGVIQGLLESNYKIIKATQRFYKNNELFTPKDLSYRCDDIIDLSIITLNKYAICSEDLRDILIQEEFQPLVPAQSSVGQRNVKNLKGSVRFYDMLDIYYKAPEKKKRMKELAQPHHACFKEYRDTRLSAIKKLCASLSTNTLVLSTFNAPFSILFKNFIKSCDLHGIDIRKKLIVFPMDLEAQMACKELKVLHFYVENSYGPTTIKHGAYGDSDFKTCMYMKTAIVKDLLDLGHDVLFMDMDIVWLKDPIDYLERLAEVCLYDFMFMYDGLNNRFQPLYYNSGFFYVKNNEFTKHTWDFFFTHYDKVRYLGSHQQPLNIIMNTYRERGLRTHRLSETKFVNGHLIVPSRQTQKLTKETFVVHASWTSDIKGKLERLQRTKLWYL